MMDRPPEMDDYDTYHVGQARLANDLGETVSNIAKRKAMRDDPHGRGWMTRRTKGGAA